MRNIESADFRGQILRQIIDSSDSGKLPNLDGIQKSLGIDVAGNIYRDEIERFLEIRESGRLRDVISFLKQAS